MSTTQRPSSSLSNHSAGSSAGAGASTMGMRRPGMPQRHRPVPGGPRKPSTKVSLPTISQLQTQQHHLQSQQRQLQQQQEQERREQLQRQSSLQDDLPPSYIQSQHESQQSQSRRPLQSYTPPPTSAVTSDSSCSHPPTSVFTRADTPSSMSAFSPVRTTASPIPVLEPLEEHSHSPSPAHQSPLQRASLPLASASESASRAQPQPTRASTPSISSKPSTPAPEPLTSSSAHVRPRMITLPMPPPLQPPPSIDFSPASIPFKALTLDAAQWTFSSAELQAIVSRAIRASAEPSSIRLLPLQTLDEDLVQEVERLESERAQAIAQYRFTMHRRTMLLQSLNASSGASASPSSANTYTGMSNLSQAPTLSPAADLAQHLAEVSVTLDRLAATLVRVSDQLAQIRSLQDVHAASALAVALRKLNASYARRTREVQTLKEKLEAVEEERDEAWRVAEELAMEFDGEEEFDDVAEGDVVNGERAVAVQATLTRASRVGMKIRMPGVGPRIRPPDADGVGRENGAEEDTMETNTESNSSPDSAAGESADATTAPIARRRRANSATSRVTAARTRSIRASKASLRFPRKSSSRPPSTYSQHSTQSGHGASSRPRSRSRANSTSSMRDASPVSTHAHGVGAAIPDVPKIPNATELARLASVKSTASASSSSAGPTSATMTVPPMPPVPPPPIETSPSKIGSFLDMTTRPNSATDEKGKSPETVTPFEAIDRIGSADAGAEMGVGSQDTSKRGEALRIAVAAQDDGNTSGSGDFVHVDANERPEEEADRGRAERDETQVITVPPRLAVHQIPFSASRIESSPSAPRPEIAARPSLHVYPPNWTRPPPDSPVDVMHGSGPHRADNGDDDDVVSDEAEDEEEKALNNAFENAYARTEMQSTAYMRSPMRTQHTQSMLPFPGTGTGAGPGNINTFINMNVSGPRLGEGINEGLRKSPASDNQISRPRAGAGPFRGAAASASAKRPASLPSAQGERPPWNYF